MKYFIEYHGTQTAKLYRLTSNWLDKDKYEECFMTEVCEGYRDEIALLYKELTKNEELSNPDA